MKKSVKCAMTVCSLVAGFSFSTVAFAYGTHLLFADKEMTQPVELRQLDYAVNESGQTYGSSIDAMYEEELPDLTSVVGDHGIVGYVYTVDMIGKAPSSPEEAMEISKKVDRGDLSHRTLAVYEADGKTVIDTFTMGDRLMAKAEKAE